MAKHRHENTCKTTSEAQHELCIETTEPEPVTDATSHTIFLHYSIATEARQTVSPPP